MSVFQFVSNGTAAPGEYLPGATIPLHHTVSLYGSVQASDIDKVEVTIYRIADDGSRLPQDDANGTTVQNIEVTTTDGDPSTYLYRFETPDDIATDLYFAEWKVTLPKLNLEHAIDRFRIAAERTDLTGDVEFGGFESSS